MIADGWLGLLLLNHDVASDTGPGFYRILGILAPGFELPAYTSPATRRSASGCCVGVQGLGVEVWLAPCASSLFPPTVLTFASGITSPSRTPTAPRFNTWSTRRTALGLEIFISNSGDTCHGSGGPAVSKGVVVEMSSKGTKRTDWKALSDSHLRNAAVRSDATREAAWSELVRRHGPGVARAILGTLIHLGRPSVKGEVEELVEATWVRASSGDSKTLRAWNPKKRGSLGAFLARIGILEALTRGRWIARRREVHFDERKMVKRPDRQLGPEQTLWQKEAESELKAWEVRLAPIERKMIKLKLRGMGVRQIGQRVGESRMTVNRLLQKLEWKLHRLLTSWRS